MNSGADSPLSSLLDLWVDQVAAEVGAILPNGHVVIANWLGHGKHPDSPHVVEFDRTNKLIWSWNDHKLAKVATNVMILDGRPGGKGAGDK